LHDALPIFRVEPPRGLELRRGEVDAHHARRAALLQPRAEVPRPAAELDDLLADDVGQDLHALLTGTTHPPGDLLLQPLTMGSAVGVLRVGFRPDGAFGCEVVR